MALSIIEFFGFRPLDPAAAPYRDARRCPFVAGDCIKPNHGACTVNQLSGHPIICCPNRLYAEQFKVLQEIAEEAFGAGSQLVLAADIRPRLAAGRMTGREVVVFGRYWGQELPLPRPPGAGQSESRKYYVDWILAKLDQQGNVVELTAVEVQTIDTTGNYSDQAQTFFAGQPYIDAQGRNPGYSEAGMNWENVNKRILPQLIYKGHVLRRESRCRMGLYFVCPVQVYNRIRERLGGTLHEYRPGNGTITFRSYELGPEQLQGQHRPLVFAGQFTTTVDQVALAFTSPMNLPAQDVYEAAINLALGRASAARRQGQGAATLFD
ncbi:MAG: hypothetical protein BGO92_14920 [Magnetospirillum sp. 64-120]|nr:MAG: hypothetical protein BGO92_14920 [Magnetospirillum sp. 64-120]